MAGLFGWSSLPSGRVRVPVDELDEVLRTSKVGAGLREVLEALGGELRDLAAARRAEQEELEAMWARARAKPRIQSRPELAAWLDDLRRGGLLARAAASLEMPPSQVLDLAFRVIGELPARGIPLAVLSVECTGDPHALDDGKPLSGLVLRACSRIVGSEAVPADSSARRRLWAELGVHCDPLSSDVLVLGLRPEGSSLLAKHLREAASAGEPRKITLREISQSPIEKLLAERVFVCENPSVVAAAADRLGASCAPLVCTQGVPSVAVWTLLEGLARGGAQVLFHCDFDWGGIRIGNLLAARLQTASWAFSSDDYLAAVARAPELRNLAGSPVEASWDAELSGEMIKTGKAVYEEDVMEELMGQLSEAGRLVE